MADGFAFAVLAAFAALVAVVAPDWPLRVPAAATTVSFLLVAGAYLGAGPRLLLKRADGRRVAWAWLVHCPYFALTAFSYRVALALTREAAYVRVVPNVFLGRRLTAREARHAGRWEAVLDLAAELPEAGPLRAANYHSIPVLDAAAMPHEQLRYAVEWVKRYAAVGPVYVHCALGHGRSALVVAAYLIAVGSAPEPKAALKHLRALRPGVRLNRSQRKALEAFCRVL
jgi:hypothetical protein